MLHHNKTSGVALLFPGQGAHDPGILEGIKEVAAFPAYYSAVEEALGESPLKKLSEQNSGYINQNLASSLLTVLAACVSLQSYIQKDGHSAHSLAGYSVGQWTALFAAGAVNFEQMIRILKKRAELMDACFRESPGGMLGVIGVKEQDLASFCLDIEAQYGFIRISNYNSVGQYSVAGAAEAIKAACEKIDRLKPKKVVSLPVSGAWHCELLRPAAEEFAAYLTREEIAQPALPVMDNVTGEYLPADMAQLKRQLANHLCSPVLWTETIRFLSRQGCKKLVEIGYGKTLAKFGFFIDFNLIHESFYG